MRIVFDIDGTLTDYNHFLRETAYPFFQRKYQMPVVFPNCLEPEDIFDMNRFFQKKYKCTSEEAHHYTQQALDDFWISFRFVKYALLYKFRFGVRECFNHLRKEKHILEIYTSRAKTCGTGLLRKLSRTFTIIQFYRNGIFLSPREIHFFGSDQEKVAAIVAAGTDLVFDDKPKIIETLVSQGIKCACVSGHHNQILTENESIQMLDCFSCEALNDAMVGLFGSKTLATYRLAANSDSLFRKISLIKPLIHRYFSPIVLHKERILKEPHTGIIYAPNHRSTLDPVVITSILGKNIHWAALLRFFEGKDSIFNNNKNPVLCKLTAAIFQKLIYFPIDRRSDNPSANNFRSIHRMIQFLRANQPVGIFPEGTTKRPEGAEFGSFDRSFLLLAHKTNAWVQPVTTLWTKCSGKTPKVIINFGPPFQVKNMTIKEAYDHYLRIQTSCLEENRDILNSIVALC